MNIDTAHQEYKRKQLNELYIDEEGADEHLKQSFRGKALEFANQHGVALKSKKDAGQLFGYMKLARTTEKTLKAVGKKFDKATHERALALSKQHLFLTQTEEEAYELLLQADCALRGDMGMHVFHVSHAPSARFSDSVVAAARQRYAANGIPIPRATLMQWFEEEKKFQKDPFAFVLNTFGSEIKFTVPAGDGTGVLSAEEQKARLVAIAMHKFYVKGTMPPELLPLNRLEQARALYSNPAYSHLLAQAPEPKPTENKAAQAAPLGPEDTGAHAIPLQPDRKKAGSGSPEAPAEDAEGGELEFDVEVAPPEAEAPEAKPAPEAARVEPQPLRLRLTHEPPAEPAETPEFRRSKELISQAAAKFMKARDDGIKAKEADAIRIDYPMLMGLLRKSLAIAMGREISAEDAMELIANGPKNPEGMATGRKGLLELFEAYQSTAAPTIDILTKSVGKEKAKLEAGNSNMYAAKKAQLDAWRMVEQMPSVLRDVIAKYGSRHPARMDTYSAIAQAAAVEHTQKTGMVIDTPEKAMELFTYTRWKLRVTRQIEHRVSKGLITKELAEAAAVKMLQDETLKEQKGFASVDGEISWYAAFFSEKGAGYPAKLVAYLRYEQGTITSKVYGDVIRRIDEEKPAITDEAGLTGFIRQSWNVWAVERVSQLVSNGLLSSPAGERALKGMLGNKELIDQGGFATPRAELLIYVKACTQLNEQYPAKLALFLLHEGGAITHEVHGAALMQIVEDGLIFKDGDEFGRFLEKVREHMTVDDIAKERKRYVRGVFGATGAFGAVQSDSGLLAVAMGHGRDPHPAPSMPPANPAEDAADMARTTALKSPEIQGEPAKAEVAAHMPEPVHSEAAPASAAASAEPALAAPQPPVPPAGIHFPSSPPTLPPIEAAKTTTMKAPKLGAAAVSPPGPQEATQLEAARTITLAAASVPAAANGVPPEGKNTDLTPIPAEIIAASASAAPAPSEELPPSFVHDLSTPGPAAEAGEEPRMPGIGGAGAAPATEAATMEEVVKEAAADASSETILAPPPEELVAQAAGDTGGTDEAGERPTLFSDTPQELLEAAAEPASAPVPDGAKTPAPFEDAYVAKLSATLFSEKPLKARVAAAVMLVEEAPEVHVPILLRAYFQQPDMQPKVISILSEKPASEVLSNAFAYRDSLAKSGVLDLPLNEIAEKYGASALPAMLGYVARQRNAGTLEESDAALAISMADVAGIKDPALLTGLLPAIDSLGPEARKGIANFARTVGRDSLQPILAHMDAHPGMNPDSAVALAKAAQDKAGNDAAPVLARILPMMGRMDQDQKSSIGVLAAKFGESAIDHAIAYGASGKMDVESAAVLSRALESIEEPRGREFLRHVLPMLEHMDDSQRGRVDDLAARYNCTDMILAYASEAGDSLGVGQALALARPLAQINEVHGKDDGVVFLPRMLRLADQMDDSQADLVKGYAVRFRGGAEGRDSVTSIQAFVAARGAALSAREAAVCASALAHINTDSSFKALGELLSEANLPDERILRIHNAVKAELSGEYGLEPVRDMMVRAAIREKGMLGPLGTLAFEIISEQEEEVAAGKDAAGKPHGPSADIIRGCVTQHLTTEVDAGDNMERIGESRKLLVKFGDYAIDPLWSVALSPDFSLYPEGHRTNVLRTIAYIAEKSTSGATKQKARECIMEAVKNTDLSPGVVGSAMKVMETNVIASLRRLIYLQQKDNNRDACIKFEQRVCAILADMGEAGHKQILEALNSRDVEEKLAGATMQGLILMHNPAITDALASDRKKPERKFPVLESVLRKLIGMLRDPEAQEEKESVAMVAYGALSAASPALPAGDLAAIVSYQAQDAEGNLAPEQDSWSRSMAAGLLVNAEGGAAALGTLIKHESLAPEVRLQVISASTAFGASLLNRIVEYARGKGMEEKYVAVNAALAPKSPFAPLLRDMAAGVEDWRQKLPAAGIEPGKPVEQWQQDVLRWAVVRGLVLWESAAASAASAAHSLAYELGMITMPEFAKDLRAALDARAKHDGMLPDAAVSARESCLDQLVAAGFKKDTLGEVLGLKDKYRAFVRRTAKNRPAPQPAQQAPKTNGVPK